MDARRTRLLAVGVILAVIGALASCSRPTAPPTVGPVPDAQGALDASASADADASADAMADASADASTDASTGADAGMEAGAAKARTVRLDEASEGKTIEVVPGQTLVVMLTANPSTGFDWAVTRAPAALGAPELGFVAGGEQPGAPGKRRITWTVKSALPAGEHAVELGYARSFEKGVAPFKTFKFKVRAAH